MFPRNIEQPRARIFFWKRVLMLCGLVAGLGLQALAADTNAPPPTKPIHFPVDRYEVEGNTLLPKNVLDDIFSRHTGTNVTFDNISAAVKELQLEYHNR